MLDILGEASQPHSDDFSLDLCKAVRGMRKRLNEFSTTRGASYCCAGGGQCKQLQICQALGVEDCLWRQSAACMKGNDCKRNRRV
eukprot:2176415-Amphidinium_carterae.1